MNFFGLKQMLLKGKDFVIKKLDELEIERNELDYVSEQIPKRLHSQLKVFQKTEIDLEPAEQYSLYFKMYPNHPVSPVLFDSIQKPKEEIHYPIKEELKQHLHSIPQFNKDIEQKAFRLKNAVDSYKQPIHELDNTIVGMYVVYFHHKKGTQVEFMHPENELTQSVGARVLHYAMPDSSHNKSEDYNFFNIQFQQHAGGPKRMLFGVSYFKQIKLTEQMRTKQEDLTRSHLQKAVCIVSVLPVFGYLKMRLAQTTKLFFENFTNFESIKHAYGDISKHLNETWKNLDINQLYIGTDLRNIVKIFRHKLMEVYKAVLYQKRIVIFSHSSSSSSSFILSLLTLFPGMITFGMENQPINRYHQMLRQFALPLHLFDRKNPLIISFHIQEFYLLDQFEKAKGRHFLIGTTNRLVKETKKISTQVLLNLEDCTLQLTDVDEGGWEGLTTQDKAFVGNLLHVVENSNGQVYEGSDDWIREQFHNYLKQRLIRIVEAKNMYRKFVKECELYQASLKNRQKNAEKSAERAQNNLNMPSINPKILDIPLPYLLSKPCFSHFLQFHNPNIYLFNEDYATDEILLIGHNDYYLGKLPKSDKLSIKYNESSRKLRYSTEDGNTKQIKFDKDGIVVSIEVGKFQNNHLIQGYRLVEGQFYTGAMEDGEYNGQGKLIIPASTYIGNFQNNMFHGKGQLVKSDKSIYLGQFKEGVKCGRGRFENQTVIQDGFFEDDYFIQGEMSCTDIKIKIEGNFKAGKFDPNEKYMYTFENGDRFFGHLKNSLPDGEGILSKVDVDATKAVFVEGKLQRIIENAEEEETKQLKEEMEEKERELKEEPQKIVPFYKLQEPPLTLPENQEIQKQKEKQAQQQTSQLDSQSKRQQQSNLNN